MKKRELNLRTALSETPMEERSKKIMEYRHGLEDGITHTLEETGKIFGLTRERIRQIEAKVMEIIRVSGIVVKK